MEEMCSSLAASRIPTIISVLWEGWFFFFFTFTSLLVFFFFFLFLFFFLCFFCFIVIVATAVVCLKYLTLFTYYFHFYISKSLHCWQSLMPVPLSTNRHKNFFLNFMTCLHRISFTRLRIRVVLFNRCYNVTWTACLPELYATPRHHLTETRASRILSLVKTPRI